MSWEKTIKREKKGVNRDLFIEATMEDIQRHLDKYTENRYNIEDAGRNIPKKLKEILLELFNELR